MAYIITAPNKKYNRKLAGVQFVDGKGETKDNWVAQWFSGREGFTVKQKGNGGNNANNDKKDDKNEETADK